MHGASEQGTTQDDVCAANAPDATGDEESFEHSVKRVLNIAQHPDPDAFCTVTAAAPGEQKAVEHVITYTFPRSVAPHGSFLNDFQVYPFGQYINLTDTSALNIQPYLIIYSIRDATSYRVLQSQTSHMHRIETATLQHYAHADTSPSVWDLMDKNMPSRVVRVSSRKSVSDGQSCDAHCSVRLTAFAESSLAVLVPGQRSVARPRPLR